MPKTPQTSADETGADETNADFAPVTLTHDRLAEIHAACFPRPWHNAAFKDVLAGPGVSLLAVELGVIITRQAADEAEILTLAVLPEARRKGVGRYLLLRAMRQAYDAGAAVMHLEVAADSTAARRLYEHAGFSQTGCRAGYYAGIDAILMQAELGTEAGLG